MKTSEKKQPLAVNKNLWKDSVSVENDWQLENQFCGETGMLQVQRLITLPCVKFWPSRTAISYPALRQN